MCLIYVQYIFISMASVWLGSAILTHAHPLMGFAKRSLREVGRVLLSGQQHCFVEAGGCFGGRERVKEREDVVTGEGVNEGVEKRKVRKSFTDMEETPNKTSERKCSSESRRWLTSILP